MVSILIVLVVGAGREQATWTSTSRTSSILIISRVEQFKEGVGPSDLILKSAVCHQWEDRELFANDELVLTKLHKCVVCLWLCEERLTLLEYFLLLLLLILVHELLENFIGFLVLIFGLDHIIF